MDFPSTLSIDFGSSYTKVGYCPPIFAKSLGSYQETSRILLVEDSPLIPTLAIATGREDKPWVFGNEAANLTPGPGMEVYTNWKAGLFNRDNNASTARSIIIAEAFFGWLRKLIEKGIGSTQHMLVRIMVPAFKDFNELAAIVRSCMQMARWKSTIIVVTEPHANAIGLMTKGRNYCQVGRRQQGVDFMGMYGFNSDYIRTARNMVLHDNAAKELRVAIVDVGAFTTDLALLVFDVSAQVEGDGLKQLKQESFPVGAHDHLHEPLWKRLGAKYNAGFESISFMFKEDIKRTLFAGGTYALMFGDKKTEIGGNPDADIVTELIINFAQEIWRRVAEPIKNARVSVVYFTGGGSQVAPLVFALKKLGAKFAPIGFAPPAVASPTGSKLDVVQWNQTSDRLERVATAIGGSSIIAPAELHHAPIIDLVFLPTAKRTPSRDIKSCSCKGISGDCGICGGSGYVLQKN